jgi:replication factor A1
MSTEDIIQQILAKQPEATREQILEKLNAAREKTGGLIADATLLRVVAAEFGVAITQEEQGHDRKLSISHVVSGLNDVTVTGRIVAVYPVKTFEGKKPGKYASLTVVDKDGILRIVLWNEKANVVESGELKVGVVARFVHGYTKEDRNGTAELHLSNRSAVEINPSNANAEDFVSISKFATKIGEITPANRSVNLAGTIKKVSASSTFTRQDQTAGTVLHFVLADDTGEVPIVVWNEKATELEPTLKENMELQVISGRVKASQNGGFEVHVDASTYVGVSATPKRFIKISSLDESLGSVNVEGEVATVPVSREVKTSKGETVKLSSFELKDDTGTIRVSAWRQHAEKAGALLMGEKIVLDNVCAKKGYDNELELSTRATTVITVI